MSKFSKQHYEVLARIIRETKTRFQENPEKVCVPGAFEFFQGWLMGELWADNSNFNVEKFQEACKPDAR